MSNLNSDLTSIDSEVARLLGHCPLVKTMNERSLKLERTKNEVGWSTSFLVHFSLVKMKSNGTKLFEFIRIPKK